MRHYFHLDQNNELIPHPNAHNAPPPPNAAIIGVPAAHAGGARHNGGVVAAPNNLSLRIQSLVSLVRSVSTKGVVIPTEPGLLRDIASLLIAMVGSLFPQWTPTGDPVVQWN